MTPQEFYDITVLHLWRQGGPARNDAGKCVYRAPDSRRCAAGYWIIEEKYGPVLEGRGLWDNEMIMKALRKEAQDNLRLLTSLQEAHDRASFKDDVWGPNDVSSVMVSRRSILTHLRGVADEHGLSADLPNNLWRLWA